MRSQSVAKQIYERDLAVFKENNLLDKTMNSKLKSSLTASGRNMYKFPVRAKKLYTISNDFDSFKTPQ